MQDISRHMLLLDHKSAVIYLAIHSVIHSFLSVCVSYEHAGGRVKMLYAQKQ
jgi:hypothetical protein